MGQPKNSQQNEYYLDLDKDNCVHLVFRIDGEIVSSCYVTPMAINNALDKYFKVHGAILTSLGK